MITAELVAVTPLIECWLVRRGFDSPTQSHIHHGGEMQMNGLVFASIMIAY
jgi:hypothetical protein